MSRKMARECAFKLIFEIPFHKGASVSERIDIFSKCEDYGKLTENDIEYVSLTVNSFFDNAESIDGKIEKSLKNWTLARLSKVNLSILRLALSEMEYGGIPFQVSINEAIELAKKFSDDEAPSFVNGVIADIIK